jgi:hypothetical protein
MGSSYSQPVSQWSKGEYPDANNVQDDLAVIATGAAVRPDDAADTTAGATPLTPASPVDGVVTTRSDVDTFTFTASGATTVAASPAAGTPNLDIKMTVLDASGAPVAVVDPAVTRVSAFVASGLNASYSFTAATAGATYYVVVDGVGSGDPLTAGKYSDYGSLGNYRVSLSTQTPTSTTPLTASGSTVANATVGSAYSQTVGSASGGVAPYAWSTVSALPSGVTLASDGTLSGTPTASGTFALALTVTDAAGQSAQASTTLTVDPAPVAPVATSDRTFTGAVGAAFSQQLTATGGTGTYTWSATGTLPTGVSLSTGGLLSGTPGVAGTFAFGVTAISSGSSATATVSLTVTTAPLSITTTALPNASRNKTYAATVLSAGGAGANAWTVTGLPSTLRATVSTDGRSVSLTGRPTARATYSVTFRVTDRNGVVATRTLSLRVT